MSTYLKLYPDSEMSARILTQLAFSKPMTADDRRHLVEVINDEILTARAEGFLTRDEFEEFSSTTMLGCVTGRAPVDATHWRPVSPVPAKPMQERLADMLAWAVQETQDACHGEEASAPAWLPEAEKLLDEVRGVGRP